MNTKTKVKFNPGNIAATPACIKKVPSNWATECLIMHLQGDWGLVDKEDWASNDRALVDGSRLLSVYALPNDPGHFYIITEADRSATTFLLPSDY